MANKPPLLITLSQEPEEYKYSTGQGYQFQGLESPGHCLLLSASCQLIFIPYSLISFLLNVLSMPDRKRTESKFSSSANKALSLHFYYLLPFPDPPCALFSWGKLRPMSYTCYVFLSSHFSRFVPTNKLLVTLSDQPGLSDHLSDHL